jgi:hypothetical protein
MLLARLRVSLTRRSTLCLPQQRFASSTTEFQIVGSLLDARAAGAEVPSPGQWLQVILLMIAYIDCTSALKAYLELRCHSNTGAAHFYTGSCRRFRQVCWRR